ncbi:sex pheromone inhibitor determinant [Enterococcus faecalis]|uniref:Sex pheromone inhibitor determinant n=2 Tax=Enterococcus faecalis TaxID=1351 RepID=IAD1_ENTFA|nr:MULTISPECIES: sex pheromone inhibitor determinant [Bacteria]P24803.1 RecName: Full=Sex pheromone inhibitor determinant; AltName: Full=iAD1; Flags: Precursor [Enterococcus faecalis V583]AAA98039.1 sex pheromone inhibitor determinant [Plasmid pAD1]HAP4941021.1 sex pheromone inhibitor determinant [Enterococcus faecalis ADL-123]HEM8842872.1 sex pheromone inhibitor determinant [Proteus mirabilis]AAO83007.1 sex pheromone inhibitor determinant [Enterococcus faecalis V583]AQL55349.1 sex pheromone 
MSKRAMKKIIPLITLFVVTLVG